MYNEIISFGIITAVVLLLAWFTKKLENRGREDD